MEKRHETFDMDEHKKLIGFEMIPEVIWSNGCAGVEGQNQIYRYKI